MQPGPCGFMDCLLAARVHQARCTQEPSRCDPDSRCNAKRLKRHQHRSQRVGGFASREGGPPQVCTIRHVRPARRGAVPLGRKAADGPREGGVEGGTVSRSTWPNAMSAQPTGNSRPVADASLMVSMNRCRSTATSNVGRPPPPPRTAPANRAYICPTLKGSPRGKSCGT